MILLVINYKETKLATITGIEKYLGSGLIKGVGLLQQQAVETAAYSKIMVITGGLGKTFCTRTIVSLSKAVGKSIALAAPTGELYNVWVR